MSHIFKDLSALPDAMHCPSGWNATVLTALLMMIKYRHNYHHHDNHHHHHYQRHHHHHYHDHHYDHHHHRHQCLTLNDHGMYECIDE